MKQKNKKLQAKRRKSVQVAQQEPTRRDVLGLVKKAALAVPVLGAVGYFSVTSVQASLAEADLTRIADGLPSVVQIHDPQCSLCQTLQKQTRRVLRGMPDESYTYLVADIKTQAGLAFATRFRATHVTLLLFDARGEMMEVVRGPIALSELSRIITVHMDKYRV